MITVTLGEAKTQERPFPKLMICEAEGYITIVYFDEEGSKKGIQVYSNHPNNNDFQMKETDGWSINKFTDYNESITIQNQ